MGAASIPILVTRAEPGASETVLRIERQGSRALKTPVLEIQPRTQEALPDLRSLSGLIFTSANGVRAFAERSPDRRLPAWCVGPATAAAAREARFEAVYESAGNAVDLANYIAQHSAAEAGSDPLLHVANHAAKGDLKRTVEAYGFRVAFAPLYEMREAFSLSPSAEQALTDPDPTIVLIHSAKGAEAFIKLCANINVRNLSIAAISGAAAQPLVALAPKETQVAPAPNEDGLFEALASVIATLSA